MASLSESTTNRGYRRVALAVATTATTLLFVAILIYLWLSPLNAEVDAGLRALQQPAVIISAYPVPPAWHSYNGPSWTIAYPDQFEIQTLIPATARGQTALRFTDRNKSVTIDVTDESLDVMPEKPLVEKLKGVLANKNYQRSTLAALLLVDQIQNDSTPEDARPSIVIERRIVMNGIAGVQFATQDPNEGINTFTSWFQNGAELTAISTYPKSYSDSDASIETYNEMLGSFKYNEVNSGTSEF